MQNDEEVALGAVWYLWEVGYVVLLVGDAGADQEAVE